MINVLIDYLNDVDCSNLIINYIEDIKLIDKVNKINSEIKNLKSIKKNIGENLFNSNSIDFLDYSNLFEMEFLKPNMIKKYNLYNYNKNE
jgi:hypothetical protein